MWELIDLAVLAGPETVGFFYTMQDCLSAAKEWLYVTDGLGDPVCQVNT